MFLDLGIYDQVRLVHGQILIATNLPVVVLIFGQKKKTKNGNYIFIFLCTLVLFNTLDNLKVITFAP
jgi:hypothetical protein